MSNPGRPVTIRGVAYPSLAEAARAHNVHTATVFAAYKRDTLDNVGTQPVKGSTLIARLAKASPEDFPQLRKEAQKYVSYWDGKWPNNR